MTAMEDMSAIVLEQADRLFQQHVNKTILAEADGGKWPAPLWTALEDAGLPLALVPEAAGGVGLTAGVGGPTHSARRVLLGAASLSGNDDRESALG
jgi:alkylation response protein AidB-like acyl-CoA dehydrogenase